jgi:hypothetical protein
MYTLTPETADVAVTEQGLFPHDAYIISMEQKIMDLEREIQRTNAFCWYTLFRNGRNFSDLVDRPVVSTVQYLLENYYRKDPGSMTSFSHYLQNQWLRSASQEEWIDVLPSLIYCGFSWVIENVFFQTEPLLFTRNKKYFLPRFENALANYGEEEAEMIMTKVHSAYNYYYGV